MKSVIASVVSVVLVSIVLGDVAWAGDQGSQEVVISTKTSQAFGMLGSARNSDDTMQYIGCSLTASEWGDVLLVCVAGDVRGELATCSTRDPDPALLVPLTMLSEDSHLSFRWDEDHRCTSISVGTFSSNEPKR